MSTRLTPQQQFLVPFLCAFAILLAVVTMVVLFSPSKVEEPTVEQPVARIEANPVPSATIPAEDLTLQERQYLADARFWGSPDLDTTSRSDAELLAFGHGVCPALEAAGNPFEFQRAMAEVSGGMSAEDQDMLELSAVNRWCSFQSTSYSEFNG